MLAIKGDFFQISSNAGAQALKRERRLLADCAEKLENRGASRISQIMHLGDFTGHKVCRIDTDVGSRFCCI
jgi:hypothetical protein